MVKDKAEFTFVLKYLTINNLIISLLLEFKLLLFLLCSELLKYTFYRDCRYEKELMHPIQNLVNGELARALLIQVVRAAF